MSDTSIEASTKSKERLEQDIRELLSNYTLYNGYPVHAVHVLYTRDSDRADAAFRYDVEVRLGFRNSD